jgi:DNA-binding NtrC family response regulator/tetratricopeptide (TPR) repeat protein
VQDPLGPLLGKSPAIAAVRKKIESLLQRQSPARRLPPILIEGETGSGKGLLARLLHQGSARADGPFVEINCAAIPETMLEAELFGYERGAFTDARQGKPGLFQAANRGTLFLDEVGVLPGLLQSKLLKAAEDLAVRRLGSTKLESVDVWILAATNADLKAAMRRGEFREDLYHRLAVLSVTLPPLRDRVSDIALLAEHFLTRACTEYGLPLKTFSGDAVVALEKHPWPGNVRELSNAIERAALLSDARVVTSATLDLGRPATSAGGAGTGATAQSDVSLARASADHLADALDRCNWNISRTAAMLGITRNTVRARITKYGFRRTAHGPRPAWSQPEPVVPIESPPSAPTTPRAGSRVKWERRRISLLRVALDPEAPDTLSARTRALEGAVEIIEGFGGRLHDLSPEGLLAAFGLEPVEDAPRRAALAAMALQRHARRTHEADAGMPNFRLGIHTTPLLIARAGQTPAVSLSSAREALAFLDSLPTTPGTIVVSRGAAAFLDRGFELRARDGEAVESVIFDLVGRSRRGVGARGTVATFVGRDGDLEALHIVLARARRGEINVVDVEGEAGIGKSRLLFEFGQALASTDTTILQADCVSYGTGVPYLAVATLIRAACQLGDTEASDAIEAQLRDTVRRLDLDPAEVVPWLIAVLDPKRTDVTGAFSTEVIERRSFEAIRDLLLALDRERPLVLVIEDLHWIDDASEKFLHHLSLVLERSRILVITTRRPQYAPPWPRPQRVTRITLAPLGDTPARALVTSLLGNSVSPDLLAVVLTKAEGNPFFLEECARAVRERPDGVGDFRVPDTVHEVLLARIDRLPLEERRLLQAAATIGRDVPSTLVAMLTGLEPDAVAAGLSSLERGEFLMSAPHGYTFKHALTHDVAYESLLPEGRRELHATLVEVMEKLCGARVFDEAARLGDHAFRGALWSKAVNYLQQAARKALAHSAFREAAATLERALEALAHLPETRESLEQGVDLRVGLRSALYPLGEIRRILDHLTAADAIGERLGDRRRLAVVAAYRTDVLRILGDYDSAVEAGARATMLAHDHNDIALQITINTYVGLVHYARGEFEDAIDRFTRNVECLTEPFLHDLMGMPQLPSVHSRMWAAWCLAEVGRFDVAIARAEEALEIARATQHPLSSMIAHLGLGRVRLRRGDFPRAIVELEAALALCREWDIAQWYPAVAAALGYAYVFTGRTAGAIERLEDASAKASAMGRRGGYPFVRLLAEAYLVVGRPEEALELGREALERARAQRERGQQALTLHLLGEVWLQLGRDDAKSEAYYREALALAEERGMRPLLALCHLGLTRLFGRTGRDSEAARYRGTAASLFKELDMPFWVGEVEREAVSRSGDPAPHRALP